MKALAASWQFWALASAAFAALTAIFGKIGVSQINSDFATLIRTAIILLVIVLGAFYVNTANWHPFIPANTGTFGQRRANFPRASGLAPAKE